MDTVEIYLVSTLEEAIERVQELPAALEARPHGTATQHRDYLAVRASVAGATIDRAAA